MTIRVLVTGFSVFPGAPYNPSEVLVGLLEERKPRFGSDVVVETALLETSYQTICGRLAAIGQELSPDIAIHFGLAKTANGFRLERAAQNAISSPIPDVAGHLPTLGAICAGPASHESNLPLEAIQQKLVGQGIPTELSDDTGGYVCNFTFYHSRSGQIPGFHPKMSGFIHIPYLDHQIARMGEGGALPRLSEEMLWRGALSFIETCVSTFQAGQVRHRTATYAALPDQAN